MCKRITRQDLGKKEDRIQPDVIRVCRLGKSMMCYDHIDPLTDDTKNHNNDVHSERVPAVTNLLLFDLRTAKRLLAYKHTTGTRQ